MPLEMNNTAYPTLTIMGSPGCGKGTQSKYMQERLGFQHISTGDLCRNYLEKNTPNDSLNLLMKEGKLLPDDLIVSLLSEKLLQIRKQEAQPNGLIMDGFPRNMHQASHMDEVISSNNLRFLGMIYIFVPDEVVFERMVNRTDANGKQRADDQEQTIKERIRIFHEKTFPLIDFYRNEYQVYEVDGLGSPEEVFERIVPVVQEWMALCSS